MAKVVVMPKLGLTMTEGKIVSWHKKEGDQVDAGENIFSVETDKLTNDIESTESGILKKIIVQEGETAACLKAVGIIAAADENVDIDALLAAEGADGSGETADSGGMGGGVSPAAASEGPAGNAESPAKTQGRITASPAAKKLAKEKGIDLTLVAGTGPSGRITREDVEAYIETAAKGPKASPAAAREAERKGINLMDLLESSDADGRIMKKDVEAAAQAREDRQREEILPMSGMRKVIAKRMQESWNLSPAVTFDIKVDMTELTALKDKLKKVSKVTYTDMLVQIVSKILLECPMLNSTVDEDNIIVHNYVNMGVAVAVPGGLLVPVLRDADKKGLGQISKEVKELAGKAKSGTLKPEDLTGGTFTITNLGMFGIDSFSPIINQPEVAILGVNAIEETVIVKDGTFEARPIMKLSLTADHRAVDGAVAAEFLAKLKQYMETPALMLL